MNIEVIDLPRIPTNLSAIDTLLFAMEVQRLAIQKLTEEAEERSKVPPVTQIEGDPTAGLPQRVTLDQMAAMVHRRKRSLERYRNVIPGRLTRGSRGHMALWDWSLARGWLEEKFGVLMPERFPGIGW